MYDDEIKSKGAALGAHAVVGLRVYLNRDFAIVGEGRYQWAEAKMGDDFSLEATGYEQRIDLSGASFTVGLHVQVLRSLEASVSRWSSHPPARAGAAIIEE